MVWRLETSGGLEAGHKRTGRCRGAAVEKVGRRTGEGKEQATCRGEGAGDLECGGGDLNFKLCINGPVIILIRMLFL